VTDLMQKTADKPLQVDGVRETYEGPDARLYRVEGALPRAWVVGTQRVVGSEGDALEAVTSPEFDARGVAVTEERVDGLAQESSGAAAQAGDADIVHYGPERVEIRARSERPGLLVLSDNYYPGWKAKVDGEAVDVERVDYLFRGVPVPAGTSTVEFVYEPLSWRVGWIVSLLALIGIVAAAVIGRRRRMAAGGSRPRTPAPPGRSASG
jgi:hypothetical protein